MHLKTQLIALLAALALTTATTPGTVYYGKPLKGRCCTVWSFARNVCVEAGKKRNNLKPCYSFETPPPDAVPANCTIWSMRTQKCFEFKDGHEDGLNQAGPVPDYQAQYPSPKKGMPTQRASTVGTIVTSLPDSGPTSVQTRALTLGDGRVTTTHLTHSVAAIETMTVIQTAGWPDEWREMVGS